MKALILIPAKAEAYSYWPVVGQVDVDNPGDILTFTKPITIDESSSANADHVAELRQMLDDAANGNPPPCDHFFWGNQTIDGSATRQWLVIEAGRDGEENVNGLVKYQRDRLASGWHVSYVQHDESFTGVDNGLRYES